MKRNRIKQILREETTIEVEQDLFPYTKTTIQEPIDIAVGLMHKAMNHLASALRNIESAIQFAGWEGTEEHDNIINQLGTLIGEYSQSNDNFNLSGDHDDSAPTGNFE